jgi:hypothetical protein
MFVKQGSRCRRVWLTFTLFLLSLLATSAWGATTGLVVGRVVDGESGRKLSGVNVKLDGPNLGRRGALTAVTDSDGGFTFTAVPPGAYRVQASLVGFGEASVEDVQVTQDLTSNVDFKMAAVVKADAAKQVIARPVRRSTPQTAQVVTSLQEQITKGQPNNLYQFGGIMFGQPGITPDSGGLPHFRGSDSDKVGYQIEGIPVTDPNLNLFATSISTVGLSRLQLTTGAFPAEYGSALGGLANQVIKTGAELNGQRVEQTMGGWGYRGTLLEAGSTSGRLNWYLGHNFWKTRYEDHPLQSRAPGVRDTVAKAIYQLSPAGKLTWVSMHGKGVYETPYSAALTYDPATGGHQVKEEEAEYNRSTYALDSLAYTHRFDGGAFANFRLYRLYNTRLLDQVSQTTDRWLENKSDQKGVQIDFTNPVSSRLLFKAGTSRVDSDNPYHLVRNLYKNANPANPARPTIPTDVRSEVGTRKLQTYSSLQWKATDRLTLDGGLQWSHMEFKRKLADDYDTGRVDPRLGASFAMDEKTVFRSTWGKLSQYPRSSMIGRLFPFDDEYETIYGPAQRTRMEAAYVRNADLGPERAEALDLGAERQLGGSMVASMTAFKRSEKDLVQLQFTNPYFMFRGGPPGARDSVNQGTNKSSGLEFKLEQRRPSRSGLSGWLSYTYLNAKSTSEYYGPAKGWAWYATDPSVTTEAELQALEKRMFPVSWAQKHTVALVANKKFGRRFEATFIVDSGSGFPFGQSGMDLGGDDPQHAPGGIPILFNGQLQPNRPVVGWTGWHSKVSINTAFHLSPTTSFFVNVDNLFNLKKPTAKVWYDPFTLSPIGEHEPTPEYPNGYMEYRPYSVVTPLFISAGIQRRF